MTDLFPVKLTIILTWNYFVFVGTNLHEKKNQNTLRQIFFFPFLPASKFSKERKWTRQLQV